MFLRNLFIIMAVVGVALAGMLYFRMYTQSPPLPPLVAPAMKPFPKSVLAPGIIEANGDNVAIGTPVSGIVVHVFVKVQDKIKKGEPLFQLDDGELLSELYIQKANLDAATAHLNRLEGQLDRLMSVTDQRAVSQEEITTKKADVAVAKAEAKRAAAEVERTLTKIERMTVKAPKDGEILKSTVHPGEFIQSSAEYPVMVMGDTNQLQIRADIDEQNASRILPGQPAIAYLKNNQEDSIPLQFVRIEPYMVPKTSLTGIGEERVDTRVLRVIYAFDNNLPFPVYVGEQVDVFIDTSKPEKE